MFEWAQLQTKCLGVCPDGEIGPMGNRMQKGIGHRPTPPAALGHVEIGAAEVVATVEFSNGGDALLLGGALPGLQNGPAHPRRLHPHLPALPVPGIGAFKVILERHERGQGLARACRAPGPAVIACSGLPAGVVAGLPAHVDHGVDGGAAANHTAAGIVNAAARQARVCFGLEAPVGSGVGNGEEISHRHLDPEPVVRPTRLQQQHAVGGIGREPIGQQAARTARTHDDVIEARLICRATHAEPLADGENRMASG